MKPFAKRHLLSVSTLAVFVLLAVGTSEVERLEPSETAELERLAAEPVSEALQEIGFTGRHEVEVTDREWLAVTLHYDRSPINPETIGRNAVVAIRNQIYYRDDIDIERFRVSLYGPPPGPGMVRVYGSARFIEGGQVTWSDP